MIKESKYNLNVIVCKGFIFLIQLNVSNHMHMYSHQENMSGQRGVLPVYAMLYVIVT